MSSPELSVVVATYNRRELLRASLGSLERQTVPLDAYEVVVVVDGSTDGTVEMLAELRPAFRLSIVTQSRSGQSAARNAGAARAEGRILVFIDDDEEAAPGFVGAHLQAHVGRTGIACFGAIEHRIPADADRLARIRAEDSTVYGAQLAAKPLTYLDCYGGNTSISRATFDQVGGYAPDLIRAEQDFEFAYRLHEAGVELVFLPDAVVSEYRTRAWKEILSEMELAGRLAVDLYRRHPAMIENMELGGYGELSRRWLALRRVALALNAPPRALARIGLVAPAGRWARTWLGFVWNYCYWRGVREAADQELWSRSGRGTLILRYRAFGSEGERPSRRVVSSRRFARQMGWLKRRGYNVISLREYLELRREHRLPPANTVVITIDGGYLDINTVARPILERLGLPATVFLITAAHERGVTDADPALAGRRLLDLDRARSMLGITLEFGAYAGADPDVSELGLAELFDSKRELERALGSPVIAFAYPGDAVTAGVRESCEQAGFWGACGIAPGHNRPATDSFELRRIEVRGTYTLPRFVATLLLGDTSRFGTYRVRR